MKNNEPDHDHDSMHSCKVVQLNKTIFLFGEINPDSACAFLAAFSEADSTPGTITVNICSGGGWVEGGMLMYDTIRTSKNVVKTVACGAVYSSAILPFIAGDLRVAQPSASFLFHPMNMGMGDVNLGEARAVMGQTARLYKMYCEAIASASKLTAEAVALLCNRESYLAADDAQRKGIVHKLIAYTSKKFKVAPAAKPEPAKKKK